MDIGVHVEALTKDRPKTLSTVMFGKSYPNSGIDSVSIDFSQGTVEAVEEFIALGHRKIALLHGSHPGPGKGTGQRLEFFKAVLQKRELPFPKHNYILSGHTIEDAHQSFADYLKNTPKSERATAVFASNDVVALGAMRAVYDAGLTIPGDISMIGVDNTPLSHFLPISLTTVSYPTREIAKTATDFLLSRMKGDDSPQREVRFSTHLVRRESIGPVPASE
jgi:LacI family transcriptional regulator